jgi:glutathionyl-hydroquinone reductase
LPSDIPECDAMTLNPRRIVPIGPLQNLSKPHHREAL